MTTVSYADVLAELLDIVDFTPTVENYNAALIYVNKVLENQWDRGYEAGLEDQDVA